MPRLIERVARIVWPERYLRRELAALEELLRMEAERADSKFKGPPDDRGS